MKRALIIPFYNFEKETPAILERLHTWLQKQDSGLTIFLVDDGSSDTTARILKDFKKDGFVFLDNFKGGGKGAAVRAGFHRAVQDGYEQIAFTDCDLHYGLEILSEKIFPALESNDLVILDRAWAARKQHPSLIRQIASGIFNRFVAILTGVALRDTQAGLKGFKTSTCSDLFKVLTISGFAFDVEILSIALFYRFRIFQIPIIFSDGYEHPGGSAVGLLSSALTMLVDLLKININWKTGKYSSEGLEKRIDRETYRITQ